MRIYYSFQQKKKELYSIKDLCIVCLSTKDGYGSDVLIAMPVSGQVERFQEVRVCLGRKGYAEVQGVLGGYREFYTFILTFEHVEWL